MAAKSFGRIFTRKYVTDMSFAGHKSHGTEATERLWRNLTLFVALPAVGLAMLNAYLKTEEEKKTFKRPEYIPYDHMYIRNKPFPWGDGTRSFFHNPHRNAIPGIGYEADEEH